MSSLVLRVVDPPYEADDVEIADGFGYGGVALTNFDGEAYTAPAYNAMGTGYGYRSFGTLNRPAEEDEEEEEGACAIIVANGQAMRVCLDKIVSGAKRAWTIIRDNVPVEDVAVDHASFFPCIMNMEGNVDACALVHDGKTVAVPRTAMRKWRKRTWGPFKVSVNTSGWPHAPMFECEFDISWDYGGKLRIGKRTGTYLDKIAVVPHNLWTQYGVRASMDVVTSEPRNVGSIDNPIASTTLDVHITVEQTLVTTQHWRCVFELSANGKYRKLACGEITPPPNHRVRRMCS